LKAFTMKLNICLDWIYYNLSSDIYSYGKKS
jgi:hypothetical protein